VPLHCLDRIGDPRSCGGAATHAARPHRAFGAGAVGLPARRPAVARYAHAAACSSRYETNMMRKHCSLCNTNVYIYICRVNPVYIYMNMHTQSWAQCRMGHRPADRLGFTRDDADRVNLFWYIYIYIYIYI